MLFSRNVLSILGTVFFCVGVPLMTAAGIVAAVAPGEVAMPVALSLGCTGAALALAGALLLPLGIRRGRRLIAALVHGTVAEGQVVSVAQNLAVRVNGRSPWVIEYTFQAGGTVVEASATSYDYSSGERHGGDPVWVVYLPGDPKASTLWPPLR